MQVNLTIKDAVYVGALAAVGFVLNKQNKKIRKMDEWGVYHLCPRLDRDFGDIWRELSTIRHSISDLKGDKK